MSRRSSTPHNEVILGEKASQILRKEHVGFEGVVGVLRVGVDVTNRLVLYDLDVKPLSQELSV